MFSRGNSEDSIIGNREHTVSQEWLEAVLTQYYSKERKNPKIAVNNFSSKQGCEASESVLSDILALEVDLEVDGEERTLHFVIKLLPLDPFSRYFVAEAQFDLREINFYTQIAPELEGFQEGRLGKDAAPIKLPIPECYLAKYVPIEASDTPPLSPTDVDESVIILEDLKYQGYQNVDFKNGLSVEQAESALEAISRLHALSLAMKVLEKKPFTERYDFLFQAEKASDSYQQLIDRGLPQLTKFLEKRSDMKEIVDRLAVIRPNTKGLINALLTPEEPMALITHTDFWCNNLVFKDNKCVVLDWQMVTCSRPTNDLALLIVSSLSTPIRRAHTVELLDCYWKNLVKYAEQLGVDIENQLGYNRARLSEDYRRSQLLALLLCIGSVDVAFGDPQTEQRLLDVLVDLHKDGVLSPDIIPIHQLSV